VRLERVADLVGTAPAAALPILDDLLHELQVRRSGADDPLEADTRDTLAREAVGLRTRAVLAAPPAPGAPAVPDGYQGDFVRSVADGAAWSDWSLGVPASVTIAQAILESNWGRSAPGNNLFGLKGEGPAGSVRRRVVEYRRGRRSVRTASFRAYPDVNGSLLDHASILANSRHYIRARLASEAPDAYAAALQGTYATDPRYAGKLVGLIARYGLDRFDWNAHSPWI
jgi:flagellum-specific peptidoglycan hydrolase FlgJ